MRHSIFPKMACRRASAGTLAVLCGVASLAVPLPAAALSPNQNPMKIFSDGFETGDFSRWKECGARNKIGTSVVHSGKFALHYANVVQSGHCATAFSQPSREIYFKFFWFLPTGFNFSFAPGKHFWRMDSGGSSIDSTADPSGAITLDYYLNYPAFAGPYLKRAASLPTGRWHQFEFYNRLNEPGVADGEVKIWIDGALRLDKTNINLNATSNALKQLRFTTNYDNCTGVCEWHMDDVEVWNGCPPGSSCWAMGTGGSDAAVDVTERSDSSGSGRDAAADRALNMSADATRSDTGSGGSGGSGGGGAGGGSGGAGGTVTDRDAGTSPHADPVPARNAVGCSCSAAGDRAWRPASLAFPLSIVVVARINRRRRSVSRLGRGDRLGAMGQ